MRHWIVTATMGLIVTKSYPFLCVVIPSDKRGQET